VASSVEDRNAIYVATAVTTGARFLRWYASSGRELDPKSEDYVKQHLREVVEPNSKHAGQRISEIRKATTRVVIEPTSFERKGWTQELYRFFWGMIIEQFAEAVVFLDDWQYSEGCAWEFLTACRSGARLLTENLQNLDRETGTCLIRDAMQVLKEHAIQTGFLESVLDDLEAHSHASKHQEPHIDTSGEAAVVEVSDSTLHFKDAVLDHIASKANVAQFASFTPDRELTQRFCRISGFEPNHRFECAKEAVSSVLGRSPDGTVNVRSFHPEQPKGAPFKYGLASADDVIAFVRKMASENRYTIVNETININDGGVSGVAMGGLVEFSPEDTPQCVDRPGVCALPRDFGVQVLERTYGFVAAIDFGRETRVEFSVHPRKRGVRGEHTIIWELERVGETCLEPGIEWPHNFSRFLGDKLFGLLVADTAGLRVPQTTAIPRTLSPFRFGKATETSEYWMRTCPKERAPGRYATTFGWCDPFELLKTEEQKNGEHESGYRIASVLAQEAVHAEYSGSLLGAASGNPLIEGVRGRGDEFMVGKQPSENLPDNVLRAVSDVYHMACAYLGPVDMEWVYDGQHAWVVQLHNAKLPEPDVQTAKNEIYPGDAEESKLFQVADGLDALRDLIAAVQGKPIAITLVGDVGITSHFGDLLRSARIPSRIRRN